MRRYVCDLENENTLYLSMGYTSFIMSGAPRESQIGHYIYFTYICIFIYMYMYMHTYLLKAFYFVYPLASVIVIYLASVACV